MKPPWCNWLLRSVVNRKAGGSSPPGADALFLFQNALIYIFVGYFVYVSIQCFKSVSIWCCLDKVYLVYDKIITYIIFYSLSIVGSGVEFSPATREARVQIG